MPRLLLGTENTTMSFTFDASQFPDTTAEPRQRRPQQKLSVLTRLMQLVGLRSSPAKPIPVKVQTDWTREAQAMVAAGDEMLKRSRSGNFALSVAVFDLTDLPELKSVFGSRVVQEVIQKLTAKFQLMANSRGLVARTGPTVFTVLLPGFGRDRALSLIREVMGHPCCIELDGSDEEIVLIPEFMVQTVRRDTGSMAEVYETLRRDIAKAQALEHKRKLYLQRERESHTRPMELRSSSSSGPQMEQDVHYAPAAATIPMPLSARAH